MATNIGTGQANRVSVKGQKAAETRNNNTKNEVEFLAGAYFDFVRFHRSTGISDISVTNAQFDGTVTSYVQLGKIKKESYNKFKSILSNCGISVISTPREGFIQKVMAEFSASLVGGVSTGSDMLQSLQADFGSLLNKYSINIADELKMALFIEFGMSVAAIYRDTELVKYFEALANRSGLGNVQWKGPQVVTRESDGCSGSRTMYGTLWTNLDKLK